MYKDFFRKNLIILYFFLFNLNFLKTKTITVTVYSKSPVDLSSFLLNNFDSFLQDLTTQGYIKNEKNGLPDLQNYVDWGWEKNRLIEKINYL